GRPREEPRSPDERRARVRAVTRLRRPPVGPGAGLPANARRRPGGRLDAGERDVLASAVRAQGEGGDRAGPGRVEGRRALEEGVCSVRCHQAGHRGVRRADRSAVLAGAAGWVLSRGRWSWLWIALPVRLATP